jgi:hypothetical protein
VSTDEGGYVALDESFAGSSALKRRETFTDLPAFSGGSTMVKNPLQEDLSLKDRLLSEVRPSMHVLVRVCSHACLLALVMVVV